MEVTGRRPTDSDGRKKSLLCDPCKGENEDEPAVSYCTMCNEYLCYGCRKAHTRAKATRKHVLLDGNSMPKQKLMCDNDSMCPKHADRALEYECPTHDQFCCSVCATIDHRQCNIQYINDIATDFSKSDEYVALEKATADLIRLLQETKGTATQNAMDVERLHENYISDLQLFRTEINNKLDLLEKAAMGDVQIVKDSEKKRLDWIAQRCDSMLSDINDLSLKLEQLNKYKQEKQFVICCKKAAANVRACRMKSNELSEQTVVKYYQFKHNDKIHNFVNLLDSLGQMKEIKYVEETNSQSTCPDVSVQTSDQPTMSYVGNIDVRHSTDKRFCCMTGGVMIDQTKLAMVDYYNSSVKVADVDTNTLVSCIKLPTQPWDITCVNRDQIVVTCFGGNKGKLVFLKVGKTLSVLKECDIGRYCRGVAYSNNTLIVSFIGWDPSVKIFDMNGKVLKTFKTNKAGDALFIRPEYIRISTDQQTVFVSNQSNHTVMSLTLDGTVQHVYTADSLKGPLGLAVGRNDNVYIAGYSSHNIHQLSTEGNHSQVILDETHGVIGPSMVTYCKTRHRLYISVIKDGRYVVSVYQLHT